MKLEDQVCSLELAKRLKKLGVKQKSYFWWNWPPQEDILAPYLCSGEDCTTVNSWKRVSAFTVAELGEMLPLGCYSFPDSFEGKRIWRCIGTIRCRVPLEDADTESDARALMVCFLLENKLMEVPR